MQHDHYEEYKKDQVKRIGVMTVEEKRIMDVCLYEHHNEVMLNADHECALMVNAQMNIYADVTERIKETI